MGGDTVEESEKLANLFVRVKMSQWQTVVVLTIQTLDQKVY